MGRAGRGRADSRKEGEGGKGRRGRPGTTDLSTTGAWRWIGQFIGRGQRTDVSERGDSGGKA